MNVFFCKIFSINDKGRKQVDDTKVDKTNLLQMRRLHIYKVCSLQHKEECT
jgi:hypothetical protein